MQYKKSKQNKKQFKLINKQNKIMQNKKLNPNK